MIVQPVEIVDRAELLSVAVSTGLFSATDAETLLGGVLDQLAAGGLGDGHSALACRHAARGAVVGWTYFAPDPYAAGVWNVWWLGVVPKAQGSGAGRVLLQAAEHAAHASGARLVVVETSSKDSQSRARRFYAKEGYSLCGIVPGFYAEGDDKVIFCRKPREAERGAGADSRWRLAE